MLLRLQVPGAHVVWTSDGLHVSVSAGLLDLWQAALQ